MPKPLTDAEFEKEVLKSPLPVVMDFWAPWCGPCRAMLPVFEDLEKEYDGKVSFMKMNVDENTETPGKFEVLSIPTFIIFKNGEPVKTIIGARSKEDMKKGIEEALAG